MLSVIIDQYSGASRPSDKRAGGGEGYAVIQTLRNEKRGAQTQ